MKPTFSTLSLFNNLGKPETNEPSKKKELVLSGKSIHSLDELKQNFDAQDVLTALDDGSLVQFLKSYYYEREAQIISKLPLKNKDSLKVICETLGIDYLSLDYVLTPQVKNRLEILKQYTLDKNVLSNFRKIALNQEELAFLLENNESTIYLCHGKFSVPLSKSGVKYIGIDNPIIENPFTPEQYKNFGISMENISLPSEVSEEMNKYALETAKENGYDDYHSFHSSLATYFHNKLKSYEHFSYIVLPFSLADATSDFTSEYSAKQKLKEYLRKPYDRANEYFSASSQKYLASSLADDYAQVILSCFEDTFDSLKTLFSKSNKAEAYDKLYRLVSDCRDTLYNDFNNEINDNRDYYNMYDFNYFVDNVSITEHDNRIGEGIFKIIETVFADNITYSYENFSDIFNEMDKDINNRASSFYKSAYRIYLNYVKKIERIIEDLGNTMPPLNENETIYDYIHRILNTEN